jgi:Ca-activated chloride channel homolog
MFLLLTVIPLSIWYGRRRAMYPCMGVSGSEAAQDVRHSPAVRFMWIMPALKYLAFVLLVAALARPQWGTRQVSVLTEGINIMLAMDVSGSMRAVDFSHEGKIIDRLEAVKTVALDFIGKREGDRIGLVVFGTYAFTQVPLTRDYTTIAFMLDRIEIGAAGENTAIGDAIGISLKRLRDIESKSNIIILLTDGESNAGELSPETATDLAVRHKVKIYTIGVGSDGVAPFPVRDAFGKMHFINQRVSMDEAALKQIAEKTGGMFFKAEDIEGLRSVYDAINALEKTEIKVNTFAEYRELYVWCVAPALLVLLFWIVLNSTRFLRIP